MSLIENDQSFTGSLPESYQTYLVPLIFEPYAADMATRVAARSSRRVLEVAAGTGVVTRALASILPESTAIVATDLNQPMLDQARSVAIGRSVEWRKADAMELPFEDESFDAVVCQFGAMFFPARAQAYAEARRVLKPGGVYFFNVWDRIEHNEFADTVTEALARLFPEKPPRFLPRTPYGYSDPAEVARDLKAGGFLSTPVIDTVAARSQAASPRFPAIGFCQGTPVRHEVDALSAGRLEEATNVAAEAIARKFGPAIVDAKIQAHVVTISR